MTILEKLDQKIKQALKSKDSVALAAVRLIKASAKNKEIELKRALTEQEFLLVLSTMVKKNKESIEQFKKGERLELAKKEEEELKIIESFLPSPLTEEEMVALIREAMDQVQAKGPKEMGAVMKQLKDKTSGRVDGKELAEKVREQLSKIAG